jgi:hypothetical protein
MTTADYGALFRQAYSVLHGGRPGEAVDAGERRPGESLEEYLSRSRADAVGFMRKRLLAAQPPEGLASVHQTLLDLLANAAEADAALASQVEAYRCGRFHESVTYSDRLHALVAESARLDRELIMALRELPRRLRDEVGIEREPSARSDTGGPSR